MSPPALTTLRRKSLIESSRTIPIRVQPTGTLGSVVNRTRPRIARSSCPSAGDANARSADTVTAVNLVMLSTLPRVGGRP